MKYINARRVYIVGVSKIYVIPDNVEEYTTVWSTTIYMEER